MSQNTQSGFKACRKLGGGAAIQKIYEVSAGASDAFYIGDAVSLQASGKLDLLKAGSRPTGVITALYKKTGNEPAPLTFSQPTNGPYLTSGTAGFALVNIDPAQTYTVQIDGNITNADFGSGAVVSAGTPNNSVGLSGQTLNGASITTTAGNHFQILDLAPVEKLTSRTSVASPAIVEVIMYNPTFGAGGNLI